ncbi:unnamed protein product [Phytophthora fragariaefolia]|uniref:Unnamed protein product n=1 Tax=Phytophthora fragariaefolia TaxID=1490495 RepID=A0A9W6XR18_9STRA|nr:unnamed protein product [Phytophthora fragariaefolia]
MLVGGAKRSKIYDHLLEHDQNMIKADIDNIIQAFASLVSSLDDNEATAAAVAALAAADPMNCACIAETETGRLACCRFLLCSRVRCPVELARIVWNKQVSLPASFMVMNEFGEGVVVQHSLIDAKGDWNTDRAIEHFKCAHPDGGKMLRVIIVNEDMNEVREKRFKPEFGKISTEDASQIDAAIHRMVYAENQDEYDITRSSLKQQCARIGFTEFFAYFTKNWGSCQPMWVTHLRSKLPHFKNHTNNRLESFSGKLKDVINSSMRLAQPMQALVASDRRDEKEYKYWLSRIGRFVINNYDEEMASALPIWKLQPVQQLQYQPFNLDFAVTKRKKPRIQSERYKEVVRATYLIASELSDLADDQEFDEMLLFVLQQWRNVRLKHKQIGLDSKCGEALREFPLPTSARINQGLDGEKMIWTTSND